MARLIYLTDVTLAGYIADRHGNADLDHATVHLHHRVAGR